MGLVFDVYPKGLAFLHEQRVAGLNCSDPSSYMVDLSSAPQSSVQGDPASFDRFSFPVRYYFVNFSCASRISRERYPLSNPSTPGDTRRHSLSPFKTDVQELGTMFDRLLLEVNQTIPDVTSIKTKYPSTGAPNFSKV